MLALAHSHTRHANAYAETNILILCIVITLKEINSLTTSKVIFDRSSQTQAVSLTIFTYLNGALTIKNRFASNTKLSPR